MDLGADAEVAQAVIQAVAPVEPTLEKVSAKDARASAQKVAQEIAENAQAPKPEYHFPPVNLLSMPQAVRLTARQRCGKIPGG